MPKFKKKTYRKKKTSWSKKSRSKKGGIVKRVKDLERATKKWVYQSDSLSTLGGAGTTVTNGIWLNVDLPEPVSTNVSAICKSISLHLQITRASAVTDAYTFEGYDQGVRVMVVCQKNPNGKYSSPTDLIDEILLDATGGIPTQATFYGSKYNPDYISGYKVVYDKYHRVEALGVSTAGAVNSTNVTMMKMIKINVKPTKYGLEEIRMDGLGSAQADATKNHWFLFVTPYDKTTGNKNTNLGLDLEWSVFYEQ